MNSFRVIGNLVDILAEKIYPAAITIENGIIKDIQPLSNSTQSPGESFGQPINYLLPGFIDAHVHIESSMLIPTEFARLAVVHGTVATVSDPHEIANVSGVKGVEYMLENAKQSPFKFYFGAPSCVPATNFETAGAAVTAAEVETLLQKPEIKYLSEMMNFPGVLQGDTEVMKKIAAAQKHRKPIDGHAPGLSGDAAAKYIAAGSKQPVITTDHECFTKEEAIDKLKYGMKILIREGSAAKNFEALIGLLPDHPDEIMFCSDDKHPDSLVEGHINQLVKRALEKGIDLFKVLKAACINPVLHYQLEVGLLKKNDPADFIVVNDLQEFKIMQTYIRGQLVAENGKTLIPSSPSATLNNFNCDKKSPGEFAITDAAFLPPSITRLRVIEALDGQLITNCLVEELPLINGQVAGNVEKDILKIAVVNRYFNAPPALAFIKRFGLKQGAIASSVAHDSHNIIAVGADDECICDAVNLLIAHKGGICVVNGREQSVLPLPVAGIMTHEEGYAVAAKYAHLDRAAKALGSRLQSPFMTLSFMALLVIPHIKLSDKGLFDGDQFAFTQLVKI